MKTNGKNSKTESAKAKAIRAVADVLGEDPANIRKEDSRWMELLRRGVIVRLHVRRWRAKTKINPEDLGIAIDRDDAQAKAIEELFSLGDKFLIPVAYIRKFDAIESSARKLLERSSYKTYWGPFVADTMYPEWKASNQVFIDAYFAARDQFVAEFDRTIADHLGDFRKSAQVAFRRLKAANPKAVANVTEDVFVARMIDRLLSLIPAVEVVRDSFAFEVDLSFVPLPSLIERDRIQAEREREEFALERDRERLQFDEERAKADLRLQMERDVVTRALTQKTELIDGFLRDLVAELQGTVYSAVTDVLESIRRNGTLQPRSVVQLKNLIATVQGMNFFQSAEVDRTIATIQGMIAQNPAARDVGSIEGKLKDIALITRATLLDLGESPRTARDLGVVDTPDLLSVSNARNRLSRNAIPVPAAPELDFGEGVRRIGERDL